MLHRDDLKVSRRTGFVADERFYWHHAGVITSGCDIASFNPGGGEFVQPNSGSQGYFENESTKRRMANLIDCCGLMEKLDTATTKKRAATKEELCYCHSRVYVDKVEDMSCRNGGDAGDFAFFGPGSYNIAALAAGCCIEAVNSVLDQALDNAYVLCRPPGHHAERDRGMGFCLFNNIAIAAEHAVRNRGKKRVAIVDWDVRVILKRRGFWIPPPSPVCLLTPPPHTLPRSTTGTGPSRPSSRGRTSCSFPFIKIICTLHRVDP